MQFSQQGSILIFFFSHSTMQYHGSKYFTCLTHQLKHRNKSENSMIYFLEDLCHTVNYLWICCLQIKRYLNFLEASFLFTKLSYIGVLEIEYESRLNISISCCFDLLQFQERLCSRFLQFTLVYGETHSINNINLEQFKCFFFYWNEVWMNFEDTPVTREDI